MLCVHVALQLRAQNLVCEESALIMKNICFLLDSVIIYNLFLAIRSGDYYLFEESEDELEHDDEGVDIIKFGMGEERDKDAPPTPMEVCQK